MADFRHSTTAPSANLPSHNRRSFLAAGAASIVAVSAFAPAAIAAIAPCASAKFDAAERAFAAADRAMTEFGDGEHERAYRAYEKWRVLYPSNRTTGDMPQAMKAAFADFDRTDARHDELHEVRWEAMLALLATPAPDANGVARKMEVLIADDAWQCDHWDESIGHVLADLRRLGSAA